jgi:hypothetical protein
MMSHTISENLDESDWSRMMPHTTLADINNLIGREFDP